MIGDIQEKINETAFPWPFFEWSSIKNKNEGGSFNQLSWKATDWTRFETDFRGAGLRFEPGPEFGFAVEIMSTNGFTVASGLRLVWRHQDALYQGVLVLKHNTDVGVQAPEKAWKFDQAVLHDVTHTSWETLATRATGWVKDVPLPVMGVARRAWQEGKDWFISQQENCLLRKKQADVMRMPHGVTKPAL